MRRVPVDRGVDGAGARVRVALHERVVALVDGALAERPLEHGVRPLGLGHDHEPAGADVQPVHDALPLGGAAGRHPVARPPASPPTTVGPSQPGLGCAATPTGLSTTTMSSSSCTTRRPATSSRSAAVGPAAGRRRRRAGRPRASCRRAAARTCRPARRPAGPRRPAARSAALVRDSPNSRASPASTRSPSSPSGHGQGALLSHRSRPCRVPSRSRPRKRQQDHHDRRAADRRRPPG